MTKADTMAEVVNFPRAGLRPCPSPPCQSQISELAARLADPVSRVKDEIRHVIFLLDLTVQHARQITGRIADQGARNGLEMRIAAVERLLEIARSEAQQL